MYSTGDTRQVWEAGQLACPGLAQSNAHSCLLGLAVMSHPMSCLTGLQQRVMDDKQG